MKIMYGFLDFHLAVQERKILETLQDIEVPCVWQRCLLWLTAPTKVNEIIRRKRTARIHMRIQ